jgi:hypothetical protein
VKFLYFFISGVKRSKKLNKDKIELIDQIACDRNNVYGSDYFIPLSLLLTILQYPYTAGKEMSLIRLHVVNVDLKYIISSPNEIISRGM